MEPEKGRIRKQIKEDLDYIAEKSQFEQSMGEREFSIAFSEGFVDDLTEEAMKSDEELEEETRKSIEYTLNRIKEFAETSPVEIVIQPIGSLADDPVPLEDMGECEQKDPEKYGYVRKNNEWYWPATWTDVNILYSEEENDWLCVVQTKEYLEWEIRRTTEYYEEKIKKARQENNIDEVIALNKTLEQELEDLEKDDIREATIDSTDLLDKNRVIEAIKIWISRYCPELKEVPIRIEKS
jgi:hypothetical protein